MSKKRVFANDKTIYYTDYIPLKNGIVCLRTIKSDPLSKNAVLNRFVSYDQFQTLSDAYYLYLKCKKHPNCYTDSIRNMTNSYKSFIKYNKDCTVNNHSECDKNYIYPKGLIHNNKNDIFLFPSKLEMENWCNSVNEICNECIITNPHIINPNHCSNNTHCGCHNTCKTGLCKNTRNLFI